MHIYDINNMENILFYAIYIIYIFYRKYYLFSFKDLHYIFIYMAVYSLVYLHL